MYKNCKETESKKIGKEAKGGRKGWGGIETKKGKIERRSNGNTAWLCEKKEAYNRGQQMRMRE